MNFDKESKSKIFCFRGPGGQEERGYTGKVVDIKRMTRNPNPGFFIFLFLSCEGEEDRAGQGSGSNYLHM